MRSASARWLTGIVSAAVVLIVVSILLNVLADDRSDDLLPADTPEGTVQRYLLALVDDEIDVALDYVDEELKANCTKQQLLQWRIFERDWDFSAKISRTTEVGDSVLITVEITETDFDPPFGRNQYSFPATFTVSRVDGGWRISEPPWPMAACPPDRELPATPEIADPPPKQTSDHLSPSTVSMGRES